MKLILSAFFLIILSIQISTAQWTMDTSGIGRQTERSIAVSGNIIFTGTFDRGVYLSTNNGNNWTQTSLNSHFVYCLAVSGSNVFAGTYTDGLFLSTNNGATWTQTSLINQYVVSLAVSGIYIFAGVYYNGVYVSSNNGATWTQTSLNTGDVYSLAVSGSNIIAGKYLTGVYISTNNGSTWTQTNLTNQTIQSLFVNGSDVYAGTYYSAGIYKSTNNGATWSRNGLVNRSVYSFALSGNTIIAGSDGYGIFVNSNNDTNWVQKNEGLVGMERVYGLCTINNYVFAATDYSEYRRGMGEFIGVKQISEQVPANFTISQNYPNPFNPTTNIKFQLPNAGFVKLTVYDLPGREIETLVNQNLNAGTYNVNWEAAKYSSGVYFYRIQTDGFTDIKKMILVK